MNQHTTARTTYTATLAALALSAAAFGQGAAPATAATAEPAAKPASQGILPVMNYGGDVADRERLTGDWNGSRTDLANKGFMLNIDWLQIAQGVVSGGARQDWDYSTSLSVSGSLDLYRMGVLPGALVRFRLEGRTGESVNDDSGVLLPVNTGSFSPLTSPTNDSIASMTELNYTQFLSEHFGVTMGKFQTMDGDPNEFASGRGNTQFMNFNFVQNGALALTVPYSVIGAGVIWLPTDKITVSSLVMTTKDSSTTTGFNNTSEGWTWVSEVDTQYKLGELPGGFNAGFSYAFAGEFTNLGGQFIPREGIVFTKASDSWAAYLSAWQYLYTPDKVPAKIDQTDGRPDLRGLGLFARFGFADTDTNPVDWTFSGGIGGRGLIPSRDNDTYGVGYVYTKLESGGRFVSLLINDSTQAFEAFYNVAVTRSVGLTFDVQWTDGAVNRFDSATILGCRMYVRF